MSALFAALKAWTWRADKRAAGAAALAPDAAGHAR